MARPQNASGERTRQAIMDAALTLFGERGFFGTSIRDIAGAVGITESAIYNYFPGKTELFEALFSAEQASVMKMLSALKNEPIRDARATLTSLALFVLEQSAEPSQEQLFRIFLSDGLRLARDGRVHLLASVSNRYTTLQDLMRRLMRKGTLRRADPEQLASEFIGALLLWRLMKAIGSDFGIVRDPEAFARQHVEHFLNGAGRTEARPAARQHATSRRNKQMTGNLRSRIRRHDSTEAEDV
jgi:TetR/AcrR family transcriptional regulator, biofilm operon repressor